MQNSIFLKTRYLNEEFEETEGLFLKYYDDFFNLVNKAIGEDIIKEDSSTNVSTDISTNVKNNDFSSTNLDEDSDEEDSDEEDSDEEDCDLKENNFLKKDLKKIYKKIVQITHPDKHPDYFSEAEKKRMLKIYTKCVSAVDEEDLFSILECASKLYIDLPKLDKEDLSKLKKKCKLIKENIKKIKNTYPWIWGEEDDESQREVILNNFLKAKGYLG